MEKCFYTQASNQTHDTNNSLALSDARRKRKDGAGLSQDDRRAHGLDLTPEEAKLWARQVNVLCVCAQMMAIVCAWVQVLLTIFTACEGTLRQCRSVQTKGRRWAESRRPESARPESHSRRRKALGEASQCAVCVRSDDGNRACVGAGVVDHFYWLCNSNQDRSAQTKGRCWAESRRPESARPGAHSRRRTTLGEASQRAVCVRSNDGNRVCVGAGVDWHLCSLDVWCVIHSPTMGCDRLDAHDRVQSQRLKSANTTRNLLSIANNPGIVVTSKMTNGISICAMICVCINVV